MTPEEKERIDGMSYESMLSLWRFASPGRPLFQGDTGDYYIKVMREKEKKLDPAIKVGISKKLGW